MRNIVLVLIAVGMCFHPNRVEALLLSPLNFDSLGSLATTGDIVMNSDTLQVTGAAAFTGVFDPASQAAVFTFDNVDTASLSVIGSHPLALLSLGNISLNGPVTSMLTSDLEIAAVGSLVASSVVSTSGGSNLSILAKDIQLTGGSRIVSAGGAISLGAVSGLTVTDPVLTVSGGAVRTGSITLTSGGGLFHSLGQFSMSSGEVQLFSGNGVVGGGAITGLTVAPDAGSIVTIDGIPAPVPLPGAVLLFGSGLAGIVLSRAGQMAS